MSRRVTELAIASAVLALSAWTSGRAQAPVDRFLSDTEDGPILRALASAEVVEARRGRGGLSLGFRVRLDDGTHAYFKPAQESHAMRWSAEVAAYHFDRELGLGRVAPSVGRRVAWRRLRAAAGNDRRVGRLTIESGMLHGALIWWVPDLERLALEPGWEGWLRIGGSAPRVSPFQRPNRYRAALRSGRRGERPQPRAAPVPDVPERPAELSDMMVFDYLAHNVDRWGGNNTNVRTVGAGGPLMFLDNGGAFTLRRARLRLMDHRLAQVQRFRRATLESVRAFDVRRFEQRLSRDPLAPLLSERQLTNLEVRRRHLVEYVDRLVERYGADEVYAW